MVARWSGPAPGLPGLSLINSTGTQGIGSNALISPSGGYKLWSSFLSGAGVSATNDTALFRSSPGGSFLVAREGDPAPGTAGAVFSGNLSSQYQFTQVNRNGTVLFQSLLAGETSRPRTTAPSSPGRPGRCRSCVAWGIRSCPAR